MFNADDIFVESIRSPIPTQAQRRRKTIGKGWEIGVVSGAGSAIVKAFIVIVWFGFVSMVCTNSTCISKAYRIQYTTNG